MFSLRLLYRAKPAQVTRHVSSFPTLRDSKITKEPETVQGSAADNPSVLGPKMMAPSYRDKQVLVWMKKFKSIEDVPDKITHELMDKTQNRFRIRLANWMMVATLLASLVMVYSGKKAAARGESVEQMNLDWHNKLNMEHQASIGQSGSGTKE